MLESLILNCLVFFFVIFLAVRLAIRPLIYKDIPDNQNQLNFNRLEVLNEIGVLSDDEYHDAHDFIKLSHAKHAKLKRFSKLKEMLDKLKDEGHLLESEYKEKLEKLQKYYKVI